MSAYIEIENTYIYDPVDDISLFLPNKDFSLHTARTDMHVLTVAHVIYVVEAK